MYLKVKIFPAMLFLSLILLLTLKIGLLNAGEVNLVRTFETWKSGIIKSTDPAGIVYHPPSGHLFIVDSEINEITAIWNCENIFEINLTGNQVFNTFDSYNLGGQPCPPTTNSRDREPTGITFNEFDGFFYISDDGEHAIMRYDSTFGAPLAYVKLSGADFEGITSNPLTGYLYAVSGKQTEVNVYTSDLVFLYRFSLADIATDPESIAYNSQRNHLFIISGKDKKIYELTLEGNLVTDYYIGNFIPVPDDPQGLTFAPSSEPNDDPDNLNLYIVDGQIDNSPIPENDRDGLIYEIRIETATPLEVETNSLLSGFSLKQNYPNPFNPETQIRFQLPKASHVIMEIYNINGQVIRELLNRHFPVGTHNILWDGKDNYSNLAPSGFYFYQLQAGNFFQVKKMILLK